MDTLDKPEALPTKNDITGDYIKTKPANDRYRANFDSIFNKGDTDEPLRSDREPKSRKEGPPGQ